MLLRKVLAEGRRGPQVKWRSFSLTQVNAQRDGRPPGWAVWKASLEEPVRGRRAFMAAEAARRQGDFDNFHHLLLDAHHRERLDLDQEEVVMTLAGKAGLDRERFQADLADPTTLVPLRRNHAQASRLGVFGTPTFVLGDQVAYIRLREAPRDQEAGVLLDEICRLVAERPWILEIKRPPAPARR